MLLVNNEKHISTLTTIKSKKQNANFHKINLLNIINFWKDYPIKYLYKLINWNIGKVVKVKDGVAFIENLDNAKFGELVKILPVYMPGKIVSLESTKTATNLLGSDANVKFVGVIKFNISILCLS